MLIPPPICANHFQPSSPRHLSQPRRRRIPTSATVPTRVSRFKYLPPPLSINRFPMILVNPHKRTTAHTRSPQNYLRSYLRRNWALGPQVRRERARVSLNGRLRWRWRWRPWWMREALSVGDPIALGELIRRPRILGRLLCPYRPPSWSPLGTMTI